MMDDAMKTIHYAAFALMMALVLIAGCVQPPESQNVSNATGNQTPGNPGRLCGDGICDSAEKANPSLCPNDCGPVSQNLSEEIAPPIKLSSTESPFAIHEMHFYGAGLYKGEAAYFADLGAKSARLAPLGSLVWDMIETERGVYDWSVSDDVISRGNQAGAALFITVGAQNRLDSGGEMVRALPRNMSWYLDFLRNASERYDGDGIDDAPGSPKAAVLQIGNELDTPDYWEDTPENYALLLKESYNAIKSVSPDMLVSIAGVASPQGFFDNYTEVLAALDRMKDKPGDRYFDILDFHWSGQFRGDYQELILPKGNYEMRRYVSDMKSELAKIGYENVSFYITEMSDYSGSPAMSGGGRYLEHTEAQQASSLVKRYAYSLTAGVEKIYWAGITEQHDFGGEADGYFDYVSLVNNPQNDGDSSKKLAYYSYKKMVETLDGSDWGNITVVQENRGGVRIYAFSKAGKRILVAWSDGAETAATVSGITSTSVKITGAVPKYGSGAEVVDYSAAFNTETKSVQDGKITITLGENPLYIEEME